MSLRFFDLLNSMIYDLKRSEDLRWLFEPVLHSSLDDLVCQAAGVTNQSNCSYGQVDQKRKIEICIIYPIHRICVMFNVCNDGEEETNCRHNWNLVIFRPGNPQINLCPVCKLWKRALNRKLGFWSASPHQLTSDSMTLKTFLQKVLLSNSIDSVFNSKSMEWWTILKHKCYSISTLLLWYFSS